MSELLIAMTISGFALTALLSTVVFSTRVTNKLANTIPTLGKAHNAYETLNSDIQAADRVLTAYPLASPTFQTNKTNTLILRIPANSGGTTTVGSYDIVIYYLAAQSGENGPFVLKRYTATSVGGVESTPALKGTICSNIKSLNYNYIAHETFSGYNSYRKFALKSPPLANDTEFDDNKVIVDGVDCIADGSCSFNDLNQLEFDAPLPWYHLADCYYSIDPTVAVTDGNGNNAYEVSTTFNVRVRYQGSTSADITRYVELTNRSALRNR